MHWLALAAAMLAIAYYQVGSHLHIDGCPVHRSRCSRAGRAAPDRAELTENCAGRINGDDYANSVIAR
jgi:hypothetical protein